MNIYDCRFIDDEDKVTHVKQYGNSEKEIDLFWREWWPMHYEIEPSLGKYVDCELFAEDVIDYDDMLSQQKKECKKIEESLFIRDDCKWG